LLTERRIHLPRIPLPSLSIPRVGPGGSAVGTRLAVYWQSAVLRELASLGLIAAVVLFSFRDAILRGLVAFQNDTQVFFYPLASWFAEELKAGRFPLWNPYIFAGYPIFADGEIGLANPLHLALLYLLPFEQAFIGQRIASVLIAAVGMYALCRALELGRTPALLGGLTLGLGSFFLHQQHHENVTRTAAWLPLLLACTEWGLQRSGWSRHAFFTAAAVALGMAAVGLHPQPLAMTAIAFSTYVVFRVALAPLPPRAVRQAALEGDEPRRRPRRHLPRIVVEPVRRVFLISWAGLYISGLGLALASIQLLPLAEMGAATYRGSQPDYFYATSYALPIQNLISLVFPYFFRGQDSEYWSLWANWETTPYVGIAPLLLAVFGIALARRREVIYFVALSVVAAWLAFATYAPFDLYHELWSLPGFSAFRVPGRYTFLLVFSLAALAAFGAYALVRRSTPLPNPPPQGGRGQASRAALLAIGGLGVAVLVGIGLLANLRASLLADPGGSIAWLQRSYLGLRHHAEGIDVAAVYQGLVFSLDFTTPRTAFAVGLIALTLFVMVMIALMRRSAGIWPLMLVGLTAVDLVAFGSGFHQKMPVDQLVQRTPAIDLLATLAREGSGSDGVPTSEWRVFTPGTIPALEYNRLVPFRIQDIGGYSSLESRRNFAYWTTVNSTRNDLLDLANVRYIVEPAQAVALPSYKAVPFDPERPLMLGARDAVGGLESYAMGGEAGDRLQIIAALTRSVSVPQGTVVAQITVVPDRGAPVVLPLRAGVEVAEWAYDRPDIVGRIAHEKAGDIAFRRPDVFPLDGTRYELYFYYAEHDLPSSMRVDRIEMRHVHEQGGIELYGLGLYNFETGETAGLTRQMRSKLRTIYRDDEVRITENLAPFPRAYVVPSARFTPEGFTALSAMLDTPFDPTREVMLDRAEASAVSGLAAGRPPDATRGPVAAEPVHVESGRVVYRASAPVGGLFVHVANYFPGWRARVDGRDADILLANSLFRAVSLPPGEHLVELWYQPEAVALGMQVTGFAGALTVASLGGWLAASRRKRPTVAERRAARMAKRGIGPETAP
jgi:hypothetical protein